MEIDGLDQMAERCCDGDDEALNRLFSASHAFAYSTALRILRDANYAEDAAQEATVKAWRSLHTFRKNCRYSTWLHRIVENSCLNILEKKKTREREENPGDQESDELWDSIADRSSVSMEDRVALRQYIEELPENSRVPLMLHFVEEFTYQEIGERLNLDAEAVRKRIRRAVASLKKRWIEKR